VAPEVSFAIYGERGWIDLLAWHSSTRTLLVIEIKTELVDVSEMVGVVDRKVRLAPQIARERGWAPRVVARWVIVGEGSTNRRHVATFSDLLRAAFPASRREMEQWLSDPSGSIAGLSFLPYVIPGSARSQRTGTQRVRKPKADVAKRDST
jgi:hypothetical protein